VTAIERSVFKLIAAVSDLNRSEPIIEQILRRCGA
jgi:hypothetical protein